MSENAEIRKKLVNQLLLENIMKDTKNIAEGYPWRLSGTKAAHDAAEYIVNTMRSNGVNAKMLETKGYLNIPGDAMLKMVLPTQEDIFCRPCAQCGSTPKEGVTAQLVFVGSGGEEMYEGKDVKGKIVLAEISFAPARPEKTRIAISHGAAGMILMNWGTDTNEWLGNGTVKPVWGNPTPENISLMDNTPPVMSITRKVGARLRDMVLSGQKVVISMNYQTSRDWMPLYIPYAEVKAENGDGDFVLVAGHMDAWAEGASDNASGNSIMMELARVLQNNRHLLKRDVHFAFWQGHENGIMEGSTWYVEKNWDYLDEHCITAYWVDTSGLWKASVWHVERGAELASWVEKLDKETFPPNVPFEYDRTHRTGDASFLGIGIPYNSTWMMHTSEEVASWNNAICGEYYHSDGDTMQFIDEECMKLCTLGAATYIVDEAITRVLPMDFTRVGDDIITRLNDLKKVISGREDAKELLELDKVMDYAQKFRKKAEALELLRQAIELDETADPTRINHTLKKLSRTIMSMTGTVCGRYEQDTYGLSALSYVMPGTESFIKLVSFAPASHEYYLWSTRARRERNRITDALRHAMDICKQMLGCK